MKVARYSVRYKETNNDQLKEGTMASSEHAILRHVYNMMTNKPDEIKKAAQTGRLLQGVAFALIVGASVLAEFSRLPDFVCILIGAAGGVVLSMPGYIRLVLANWGHLAPHIDERSVKARLDLIRYKQ